MPLKYNSLDDVRHSRGQNLAQSSPALSVISDSVSREGAAQTQETCKAISMQSSAALRLSSRPTSRGGEPVGPGLQISLRARSSPQLCDCALQISSFPSFRIFLSSFEFNSGIADRQAEGSVAAADEEGYLERG